MDPSDNQSKTKKMDSFERSYKLTRSSWQVLKLEKSFFGLTAVGWFIQFGIVSLLLVVLGFYFGSEQMSQWFSSTTPTQFIIPSALLLLIFTFIGSLVYGAISYGSVERFKGNDPTIKSCLQVAYANKKPLFLFSLLSATVGFILNQIEERVPLGGKVAVWLTGAAWSLASMFAVPFIVTSNKSLGPITATKKSVDLIRKVWGESVIVSVGVGILGFVIVTLYLIFVTFLTLILSTINTVLLFTSLGLGGVGLFVLLSVFSVLSSIVQAAIFYWATTGEAPKEFDKELLRASMTPKKARKIFG